ncbi:hypothetical protein KHM19_04500 [Leptospira borgpetersenii]|nr:hypothetical protein LBBP_01883 [Leptospira borgpetersenii serovar Ballum]EKP13076.1 hypothetical protein LEP1GSC128_3076 [Leptospira borgpetersenii str. 200801926]EKQ91977.1 hypothetical protein LEP1GSC101_3347 [Leptospira borgpetersenii str. UI 09149]EKR01810.1 hypothetical protein LEP1GSC121_4008 [Leptospira borgpetersenii serovar Castellonis str. 200801910]EMK08326.1 hypothetical protein LEP1GSC066_1291 [Leptospira sp. serovar Kenya str. Sh9]EMN14235.1 hypothetical protein LEP1GSC055_24
MESEDSDLLEADDDPDLSTESEDRTGDSDVFETVGKNSLEILSPTEMLNTDKLFRFFLRIDSFVEGCIII